MTNGFVPKITLPTRLTNNTGTLIDNNFCKLSDNFSKTTSGIIINRLSDHLPYYTCLDYLKLNKAPPRFITYSVQNKTVISKLKVYLKQQEIYSHLDTSSSANSNLNYDILHNILQEGLSLHMGCTPFRNQRSLTCHTTTLPEFL